MINVGRINHNKYRTKYWKQRQTIHHEYQEFISSTVIQGSPIAKTIFSSNKIQQQLYKSPKHYQYIQSTSKSRENERPLTNNITLKLELFKLTHNETLSARENTAKTQEMSAYTRYGRYHKAMKQKKNEEDYYRPYTSLNMDSNDKFLSEMREKKEITLKQKLLYYQKNNHSIFLPLTSSKNQRPKNSPY